MNWPAGFLLSTAKDPECTIHSTAVTAATTRKPSIATRADAGVRTTAPTTIANPVSSTYWRALTALRSEGLARTTTTSHSTNGATHATTGRTAASRVRHSTVVATSGTSPTKQAKSRASVAATCTPPVLILLWIGSAATAAAAAHHGFRANNNNMGTPASTTACRGEVTPR
jgi:hypothetical protein